MFRNVMPRNKRPGGRKPIGKKAAAVFAMRIPQEIADRVDEYAARDDTIKSRSEAIRRLIEHALESVKRGR
jgi:metal-responsive CopG/Arc/MetJ family transcriptional regulator